MELINKVKGRQTTLDRVASQQVANQPWRQPGETQGALAYATGDNTPAQGRGLNQLYGAILNRQPGQTRIGAATEGFERGSQLIDQIREKEKMGRVGAAQVGVEGAQQDFKNNSAMYALGENRSRYDAEQQYQRERDKVKDAQWKADLDAAGEDKVYAAQVKEQIKTSNDLYKSESNATQAEMLAQDMSAFAQTAPGGLRAQVGALFKDNAGLRDQVSAIRTRANQLINTQVINNLPPGVASDRDIELARRGLPNPDAATVQELMEYAQAVANIERGNSMYQRAKIEYMDNNNYSLIGFQRVWDEQRKSMNEQMRSVASPTPVGPSSATPPALQFTPDEEAQYQAWKKAQGL